MRNKKRYLVLCLSVMAAFCGCGRKNIPQTTQSAVEAIATVKETDTQKIKETETTEETVSETESESAVEPVTEHMSETMTETTEETVPETTTLPVEIESETALKTLAEQGGTDYVSFLFAGDICLEEDGFVLDYYDEVGQDLTKCISPNLLNKMASADIFMLNHEYSISDRGSRLDKYYTFRAMPQRMEILKQMSVDIVSLANNHVYDYGYDAFSDTISLLDQAGIRHVGAGLNRTEAEKVEYFDVKGMRIGVVSASRAEKNKITPDATDMQAGVFAMYDDTRLLEVAAQAATQCDFLIAYLHWGTEDSKYFESYQERIANQLVDAGVDAIIGGHPHVVQGMEYIGDVPVLYSLGDFWFNGENKYSMMVELDIYRDGSCSTGITACRQKDYTISDIEDAGELQEYYRYLSNLSPNVSFGDY